MISCNNLPLSKGSGLFWGASLIAEISSLNSGSGSVSVSVFISSGLVSNSSGLGAISAVLARKPWISISLKISKIIVAAISYTIAIMVKTFIAMMRIVLIKSVKITNNLTNKITNK